MLPPSLPQVVVPIPSLLAFPFISENATATYVSVSFALAFAVRYRSRTKRDAGRGGETPFLAFASPATDEEFRTGGTYYPIKEGHACSLSMINLIGATYLYFTEIDREPYCFACPFYIYQWGFSRPFPVI